MLYCSARHWSNPSNVNLHSLKHTSVCIVRCDEAGSSAHYRRERSEAQWRGRFLSNAGRETNNLTVSSTRSGPLHFCAISLSGFVWSMLTQHMLGMILTALRLLTALLTVEIFSEIPFPPTRFKTIQDINSISLKWTSSQTQQGCAPFTNE